MIGRGSLDTVLRHSRRFYQYNQPFNSLFNLRVSSKVIKSLVMRYRYLDLMATRSSSTGTPNDGDDLLLRCAFEGQLEGSYNLMATSRSSNSNLYTRGIMMSEFPFRYLERASTSCRHLDLMATAFSCGQAARNAQTSRG